MDENNILSAEAVAQLRAIVDTPLPDDGLTKAIGQFLYFQNRIELHIEKLVLSLCPQLTHFLKNKNRMGFGDKLVLLESVTPDFDKLPLFELLNELNKFRNKLAHKEYNDGMFDADRMVRLVKASFFGHSESLDRIGNAGKITIAVKAVAITNMYMEIITSAEKMGRDEDEELKARVQLFDASLYGISRRFRNLIMKFQMNLKDAELKEYQRKKGNFS